MKKLIALFAFGGLMMCKTTIAQNVNVASVETVEAYVIDDSKVDALLNNSVDVTATFSENTDLNAAIAAANTDAAIAKGSSKNVWIAVIIDFFIGGFGVHRAYLGTETFTWIGYILTCGGIFGIVPFVDLVVLIINSGNVDKYVDNPKFFMW